MTFYEKIIQELETQEQSLSTVYHYAFRFSDEALFEWDENGQICTLSYGEAQKQIEHATAALHQLLSECVQHTPVGIYLPNSPSWVISFWAILRAGFYPLLLNTNAPKGTAERCVYEAGANYVISDKPLSGIQVMAFSAEISKPFIPSSRIFAAVPRSMFCLPEATPFSTRLLRKC